jgi:hypothetical protein
MLGDGEAGGGRREGGREAEAGGGADERQWKLKLRKEVCVVILTNAHAIARASAPNWLTLPPSRLALPSPSPSPLPSPSPSCSSR